MVKLSENWGAVFCGGEGVECPYFEEDVTVVDAVYLKRCDEYETQQPNTNTRPGSHIVVN